MWIFERAKTKKRNRGPFTKKCSRMANVAPNVEISQHFNGRENRSKIAKCVFPATDRSNIPAKKKTWNRWNRRKVGAFWKVCVFFLVIQSDLFGMFEWPFKGLSDLQLGDRKVTAWITWLLFVDLNDCIGSCEWIWLICVEISSRFLFLWGKKQLIFLITKWSSHVVHS